MPIAHRRPKARPRPRLVDLGNIPTTSLNCIIPSDVDTSRIKASLFNATLELEQLESNISRTQRRLESLCSRREELRTQAQRYRIALAPYKRLPTEVMREIFVACMPEAVHLPPRPDEAPLLLTRVCSSWRALALETQELWSAFGVALGTRAWGNNEALNALRTWLSRCPDRPLSFKIIIAPRAPFPLPGVRHPILPVDLVVPHTRRIRRLELQNISGEQMNALIALPPGTFPLLEEVDFFLRDSWMFRMEPQDATAFRDATRLRSVSIRGLDGTFNPVALNLPWSQLHTLHFDTLLSSPIGCHAMLRLCASLREASIRVMRIEDSTSRLLAQLPPTHLPNLRSLVIRFESTAFHNKFIDPLVLPTLRSFQTRFDWRNDASGIDDAANCYTELISRSACPIERLHLFRNSLEMDLGALFEVATELKDLLLVDHVRVPAEVWARVGRGEIGAKLERLRVDVAVLDPLLSMLEAKMGVQEGRGADAPMYGYNDLIEVGIGGKEKNALRELELGCPKLSFQQRWRVERLEKLGMRITLCHYGFFDH